MAQTKPVLLCLCVLPFTDPLLSSFDSLTINGLRLLQRDQPQCVDLPQGPKMWWVRKEGSHHVQLRLCQMQPLWQMWPQEDPLPQACLSLIVSDALKSLAVIEMG